MAGLSTVEAVVMSATTFAGAAQLGAIGVIGASDSAVGALLTGVVLNLRYVPMGITAARAYRGSWWLRAAQAQLLGDEAWALSRSPDGRHNPRLLLMSGAAVYVVWTAGTAIGAIGLSSFGNTDALGLDMVSPAIFVALLGKQLTTTRALFCVVLASAIALCLTPITPPGVPVVAASLVCLVGLVR